MKEQEINEQNYRIVKAQILAIKKQLEKEFARNVDSIKALEDRQKEIKSEWKSFSDQMEKIGEFELESEYKLLELIEGKCKACGRLYDKRLGSKDLCTACFTSNA